MSELDERESYVEGVLKNNGFLENELDYYMGLTDKHPHGIANTVWKEVSVRIGFNRTSLKKIGEKYFLSPKPEKRFVCKPSEVTDANRDAFIAALPSTLTHPDFWECECGAPADFIKLRVLDGRVCTDCDRGEREDSLPDARVGDILTEYKGIHPSLLLMDDFDAAHQENEDNGYDGKERGPWWDVRTEKIYMDIVKGLIVRQRIGVAK